MISERPSRVAERVRPNFDKPIDYYDEEDEVEEPNKLEELMHRSNENENKSDLESFSDGEEEGN